MSALPETIPFRPAFMAVFAHVLDNGYNALSTDPEGLSGSDLREQLDNAIYEALAALCVDHPAGDSLDWLGQLHDWIGDAYKEIAATLDATTDSDDSYAGQGDEDEEPVVRFGSDGQPVHYADADDASEHLLRMQEGLC